MNLWKRILRGAANEPSLPRVPMNEVELKAALMKIQCGDSGARAIVEMAMDRASACYMGATRPDLPQDTRNWYLASSAALHQLVMDVLREAPKEDEAREG